MIKIAKVITGGQTGADQAGWRAAKSVGIPVGGIMPRGFLTEDGPKPEFANLYKACESESLEYRVRTLANVDLCEALIWFGNPYTPGGKLTIQCCHNRGVDYMVVINKDYPEDDVSGWIEETLLDRPKRLMVAGNRESKSPGIGVWVEAYMIEVFRILGYHQ